METEEWEAIGSWMSNTSNVLDLPANASFLNLNLTKLRMLWMKVFNSSTEPTSFCGQQCPPGYWMSSEERYKVFFFLNYTCSKSNQIIAFIQWTLKQICVSLTLNPRKRAAWSAGGPYNQTFHYPVNDKRPYFTFQIYFASHLNKNCWYPTFTPFITNLHTSFKSSGLKNTLFKTLNIEIIYTA